MADEKHFDIEGKLDSLFSAFRKRLKLNDPLQIVPYRTYGTTNRLFIKGRVLEDKLLRTSARDSLFTNLVNMYKRFESDEVPNAGLSVVHQNKEHLITTNEEGYFELNLAPDEAIPLNSLWHPVNMELRTAAGHSDAPVKAEAEVLIPPFDAEFGVISDIDDTIVETSATNFLKMAQTVFLNNAHTRMPFAGVSAFYRSLQLGRNGKRNNPFFYVSSSPWNLYDLLKDYLDLNDIPAGPILLRDFGFEGLKFSGSGGHLGHKMKEIENILLTYPRLNFILIGDSGQDDPGIYKEVVARYPGRILAIYIRNVQHTAREKIAKEISLELRNSNVEMLIIDNAEQAAEHAVSAGFIYREEILAIRHDKRMDEGELQGKENVQL